MKITDKQRINYMLRVGAIGGEWWRTDVWPDKWDGEVVRVLVDAGIRAEAKVK